LSAGSQIPETDEKLVIHAPWIGSGASAAVVAKETK
jgi:hypothetical protein